MGKGKCLESKTGKKKQAYYKVSNKVGFVMSMGRRQKETDWKKHETHKENKQLQNLQSQ